MLIKNYRLTYLACYIGYIVQALVNNLTPLLYAKFNTEFGITTWQLSIIPLVNFSIQLLIDVTAPFFSRRFGIRKCTIIAHTLSVIGMIFLCILPYCINPFTGIIISTLTLAIGGGFIEVVVSPLVDALPAKNKSGAMNILHSFYCFGYVITVLISTLYFNTIGIDNWRWLPIIVAIIPLINLVIYSICPMVDVKGDEVDNISYKSIFTMKGFIFLFIAIITSGAGEIAIAQWASYFGETCLNIQDKTTSDLLGICMFGAAMAFARLIFGFVGDKIDTKKALTVSFFFLIGSYALVGFSTNAYLTFLGFFLCGIFVAILWPSLYSLAAKTYKNKGTRMFGILAFGGDIGCTLGPTIVGVVSTDIKTGLAVSIVFPVIGFIAMILFIVIQNKSLNNNVINK